MIQSTLDQNWKYEERQCNYHQLEHDPIYYDMNLAAESAMTTDQKRTLSAYRKYFPHYLNHKLGLSDAFLLTGSMQNEMYLMSCRAYPKINKRNPKENRSRPTFQILDERQDIQRTIWTCHIVLWWKARWWGIGWMLGLFKNFDTSSIKVPGSLSTWSLEQDIHKI